MLCAVRTFDYSIAPDTGPFEDGGEPDRLAPYTHSNLREIVGADHLLGIRVHCALVAGIGFRHVRVGRRTLFLLPPMARHPALTASFTRFLAGPFVSGALLMRRLAALARDLSLLVTVHRCKAAIFFCHATLLRTPVLTRTLGLQPMCH